MSRAPSQRDAARISDLRTLSGDVAICFEGHQEGLPETLSPLECARNAGCQGILIRQTRPHPGEFDGCEPAAHYSDCEGMVALVRAL